MLPVIAASSGLLQLACAGFSWGSAPDLARRSCQYFAGLPRSESCGSDEGAVAADSFLQHTFTSRRSAIAVADEGRGEEELLPSPGDLLLASDFTAISDLVTSTGTAAKLEPAVLLAHSVHEVFPDMPDPACVLHSSCTENSIAGPRGLCVLPAAGTDASGNTSNSSNECWDVCNLTHTPAEYSSSEGDLAQAVVESVAKIRAGEYSSITCPGTSAEGHADVHGTSPAAEPVNASTYAKIFPDTPDRFCNLGQSCSASGIPSSRGICVFSVDGPGWAYANPNECWDICNTSHSPKAYKTGSRDLDRTVSKLVRVIRRGRHPSLFCPFRGPPREKPAYAGRGAGAVIFADTPDPDCTPRSACTAGGIPALRGVCVVVVSAENGTNTTECWDVCNREHDPTKYAATPGQHGDPVSRVVAGIRADKYPSVRCPPTNATTAEPFNTTFVGFKSVKDRGPSPGGAMMPMQIPMDHRVRLPQ